MPRITRAVRPNLGTRMRYQRQMQALIRMMAHSVEYWLTAQRKREPPRMAMDALPADAMRAEFDKLAARWQKRFDDMAPTVAENFLKKQYMGTDAAFTSALKAVGWTVKFTMTPLVRDAFEASLDENVGLIRSIATEYLDEVRGIVMRNYAQGHSITSMSKDLHHRFHVSRNRAVLIARDQSSKANAVVQRARQKELHITEAIWIHSHAGRVPRPSHLRMDGKRYKVSKGMWDSDAGLWVLPGELINCRCVSKSVLPSISDLMKNA